MQVIKRDGTFQEFDSNKIKEAIEKAFDACGYSIENTTLDAITQEIKYWYGISIEEIQDQIEEILMDYDFPDVAKKYILYREKRRFVRELAEKNIQFIKQFTESDNTANATIDDNSNVSNHNIAVLNSEIHKPDNQITNIQILEDKVRQLYPEFPYKQMRKDFDTIMYLHDSSSQIGMPYCVAVTMYPFLLNGIKDLGGLSAAPKNIDSFCGMFINMVFAIAGQYKGAVATPGVLNCFDYFCRKEWGDKYYIKADVEISTPHSLRRFTIKSQIHQYFQQITYSLMQPSGSRGSRMWPVLC